MALMRNDERFRRFGEQPRQRMQIPCGMFFRISAVNRTIERRIRPLAATAVAGRGESDDFRMGFQQMISDKVPLSKIRHRFSINYKSHLLRRYENIVYLHCGKR